MELHSKSNKEMCSEILMLKEKLGQLEANKVVESETFKKSKYNEFC